jgi:lysophospholipase L1-like esterase
MPTTRRDFLAASAAFMATTPHVLRDAVAAPPEGSILLFQGDSITDAGRNRAVASANNPGALGGGYPLLLFAMLRERFPANDFQVFNRGISGNIVPDLAARWQTDTLDLKPEVLSILIGVNDIWHFLGKTPADEVVKTYEAGYAALLDRTRAALPGVKLVVLEPFVLRIGAVTDAWFPEFDQLRAACRRVSDRAGATFVGLHEMFQKRAAKTGPGYWAADGVHPTPAGHEAIALEWLDKVRF